MRSVAVTGLMLFLSGCAATAPVNTEESRLQVLIEVPAMKVDALSRRTLAWMGENSITTSRVIEVQGKDTSRIIIGHGLTEFSKQRDPARYANTIQCDYTLTVEIWDGRERLTLDNWIGRFWDQQSHPVPIPVTHAGYAREVKAKLQALVETLDSYLRTPEAKKT